MNRICHVHVGIPKTGSTAIQTVFSRNPDPKFLYAPFPNANHSSAFAICFENRPEASRVSRFQDLTRETALERRRVIRDRVSDQLNEAAASSKLWDIVVSGERLSNAIKANEIAHRRFKQFFSEWAEEFRIYGYVRPLHSLLPSDFQQRIRIGKGTNLDLDWYYPHYRRKFEKLENVYGSDVVSLRHFSRNQLVDGDVVKDFAAQIGAKLPESKTVKANTSLKVTGTAVVYVFAMTGRINDLDQANAYRSRRLVNFLMQLPGPRMAFCRQGIAELAERNKDDLNWIEQRIGKSLYEDVPPQGVVIRKAEDLIEIAFDVASSGMIAALPPNVDTPPRGYPSFWDGASGYF